MSADEIFLTNKGVPQYVVRGFESGFGAQNNISPWSTAVETYDISVQPGQILSIVVGFGGQGGRGGLSQHITTREGYILDGRKLPVQWGSDNNSENKDYLGKSGENGTAGSNGYIAIEWDAG